jgi:hypothetical protein
VGIDSQVLVVEQQQEVHCTLLVQIEIQVPLPSQAPPEHEAPAGSGS